MKINLLDLTLSEMKELFTGLGEPGFRAKQAFEWLYRGAEDFSEMTNLSKPLRERLSEMAELKCVRLAEKFVSNIDETRRYLLQLNDGNYIESVLMKYHHGYTICISSQVGCAMGCAFCASTRLGKLRNLTPGEMAGQVLEVQKDLGERISNIVMMGIGEPLDNYENVLKFLENVCSPNGLNIGQRHITLSTCGLADRIRDLADRRLQITLSISLHAADDAARSEIMPVNRRYPISELLDACRYYIRQTNRRISFEYTLIAGRNDSPREADALARLVSGLLCHINLIPVNEVEETSFSATGREGAERFRARLESHGLSATIRREMGSDISAACGQLRSNRMKQKERSESLGN